MSILSKALTGDTNYQFSYKGFQKYMADRTGYDGGPPNLPGPPNIPLPNDRNIFNVTLEKFNEGMAALTGPDSGLMLLGNNIAEAGKGLFRGIENPERTFNENFGGGNWMKRFGIGGDDGGGGSTGSSSTDTSGGGGNDDVPESSIDLMQSSPEEERARMDAIRRMLAGRYGRAETNLTGGMGYGRGSGRSIGGFSG